MYSRLVEVEDRLLRPEEADQLPYPLLALEVLKHRQYVIVTYQLHRRRLVRDDLLQLRLPDVVLLVELAHLLPRDSLKHQCHPDLDTYQRLRIVVLIA